MNELGVVDCTTIGQKMLVAYHSKIAGRQFPYHLNPIYFLMCKELFLKNQRTEQGLIKLEITFCRQGQEFDLVSESSQGRMIQAINFIRCEDDNAGMIFHLGEDLVG
jgi:hypothetical protein